MARPRKALTMATALDDYPDIHASYRVFQKGVKDRLRKGVRLVSERRSGRSWNQIAGANKISVAEARALATETFWGVEPQAA